MYMTLYFNLNFKLLIACVTIPSNEYQFIDSLTVILSRLLKINLHLPIFGILSVCC